MVQVQNASNKLSEAKKRPQDLLKEAEKIAPAKEWRARLDRDDLPPGLQAVNTALGEFLSNVNAMKANRNRKQKIANIGAVKSEIRTETIFESGNAELTKKPTKKLLKKRISLEETVESKDDVFDSSRKKKTEQSVLSSFFPDRMTKKWEFKLNLAWKPARRYYQDT